MASWTLPLFSSDEIESTHVVVASVTSGSRRHHISRPSITIFILFLFLINHSSIQTSANDFINDANNDRGLFPPTFNLASTANITSNATCGENGEETFCKLVEHVRAPQCGVCDAKSWNTSRRHPITNAIDGTNQWWQSPSLQNGRQYEWVTITLDLHQIYQVAYVIVKVANSPRPGNWILERSLDGVKFLPWQYYAINEAECIEIYGIHPTVGIPRYRSDDEVICTAYYSRLEPLENGEIHTSLVKGRPGVSGPTDKLQEFTAARFVRLRLQKVRSLHADLMTVATRGWETVHKTVTRRLFYSIKDISIGGQCMCFGHAQDCRSDIPNKNLKCHCVHNTCGDSCEKCCPLYNQKPWRLGTSTDAGVCEKCQCYGHAYECRYEKEVATAKKSLNIEGQYEGGGVCVDCRDFTTGINCEQCVDGYYRPLDVPPDSSRPCLKCNCSGFGTVGHCIKDISLIGEGKKLGDCICREGFAGAQCDRCAIGYRNYPVCDLCPCNFAGTLNTDCEGMCICKPNVDGVRCDRCKPGHFNLDAVNSKGCRKCYCSGATSRCVSADMGIEVVTIRNGWQVSDAMGQKVIRPTSEGSSLAVASDEMTGHEAYFWLAPEEFTGNKLNTYGGEIRYNLSWVKARGDSAGYLTAGPAIVLDGGGMMIAYWGSDIVYKGSDVIVDILLTESGWTHFSPDQVVHPKKTKHKNQQAVSRKTFMEVLVMLDRFLIQAKYHTDQLVGKLNSVSIEMGSEDANTVRRLKNIEKCQCPIGYTGLSCETCESGYRRVNNSAHGGKCEKCDCYNHVDSCDPYTGTCHDCLHHTTGDKCEECESGYYGVATNGSPDDCKRCACPLDDPTNPWNLLCTTIVVNSTLIDYTCDDCPVGHSGSKCEICDKGYFGNPMTPGNYCQPCNCYGYNNETIRCDNLSGQCLDCPGNREGWHCDLCKDGYWGNPLVSVCQACKCDPFGSIETSTCDKNTGECQCRPLYVGLRCDRCTDNYGNVEAGCNICDCNEIGSESSTCDAISGQCECKAGVFGTKCDACLDGYYGFSLMGCQYCNCNSNGAMSSTCDAESGQCPCTNHAIGRQCDQCEEGFWNLTPEKGCESCHCNPIGSMGDSCDSVTGQCLCREGVGSTDCSKCLPGFYGFSKDGCQKCDECDIPGHLCDSLTGNCVCPPLTTGDYCEKCVRNGWGFDSALGCQDCNCSLDGSLTSQCDVQSGECECLEGYEGRQCNRCRFGYFDFLKCKRCKCHLDGTDPSKCRLDGHCECSEDGQCPCKINVEGKKCRRCRTGTFGRTPIQVEGCTPCFCFGKSSRCRQAELTWTRLAHLDSRKADASEQTQSVYIIHGLRVIPGVIGDVEVSSPAQINAPLYWKLPDTLQGDLVSSYNGRLVFRVGSEGGQYFPPSVLNTYPLVLFQGNHRLILEYYPETHSTDGWFDVHLHESRWKFKNNPDIPVDRPTMMVALQRVQHILIRATDRTDFTHAWLTNVSIDTLASSQKSFSSVMAIGIEICQCPIQYNGTSCQDPADGYYRFRKNNSLDSKDILELVGISLPCPCNGRSKKCDKETGICKDCQLNTSGNNCERCADGFYGEPSVALCQPCACPTVENSFSEHCAIIDSTLTCTHCRDGHYGNQCELCLDGYYGDPLSPGGKCLPCNCNNRGSLGNFCDKETGQCLCLDDLSGRDCSICPYRHVLTDYGCQSCIDECTGLQLDELDDLHITISSFNISGINPAPWNKMSTLENRLNLLYRQVDFYKQSLTEGQLLAKDFESTFNLEERADQQLLKILEFQRNSSLTCNEAVITNNNAEMFLKQSLSIQQLIAETVRRLKNYAVGIDKVSVQLGDAVYEAKTILKEIVEINFSSKDEESQREFRKAKALLDQVRKLLFDPHRKNKLEEKLKRLEMLLKDVHSWIPKDGAFVLLQLNDNILRFNRSKELFVRAEEITSESKAILNNSLILLTDSKTLIDQAKNNLKIFEDFILRQFLDLYTNLTVHNGVLALKLPEATKKVALAINHANELEQKALNLLSLFNSTFNESTMAMKAATAYSNVIDKLTSANEIAIMARQLAMETLNEVQPKDMLSYSEKAMFVLKSSKDLFMRATNYESIRLPDLQMQWKMVDGKTKAINSTIKNNNKNIMEVKSDMDKLKFSPSNFHERIGEITDQSVKAKQLANSVKNYSQPTITKLKELSEQAKTLALASNDTIWNITKKVNKTMSDISRLSETTAEARKLRLKQSDLKNRLQNMKQDIAAFRQTSGNWLIGLNGDGKCKRELKHDIHSVSFSNVISFNYAISSDHQNSLIFYLGDSKMGEFLAMEMVNRTMRFVWDSGGGRAVVDYLKLPIETLDINFDKNSQHYQVEAVRIGNKGSLKMKTQKNKEWLEPSTKELNSDHHVINFGPETRFLIGSLPNNSKANLFKSTDFYGCLSNFKLNNENIGLWNFASEDQCLGCKAEPISSNEYGFRGNGYIRGINSRRRRTSQGLRVTIVFRTFNEYALLFFASDQNEDGFFAVYISGGYVHFKLRSHNGFLELHTVKRYNDNRLIRIEAYMDDKQGLLRVRSIMAEGQPEGLLHGLIPDQVGENMLDLSNRPYYVGGLPHTMNLTNWMNTGVSFQSFYGCLSLIQLGDYVLDPTSKAVKSFGVTLECPSMITNRLVIGQNGYLEIKGFPLITDSSIGFTVRPVQKLSNDGKINSILLLSTFINDSMDSQFKEDFYSLALKDEELIFNCTGAINIKKYTNRFKANETQHVLIKRLKRSIEVRVNDNLIQNVTLISNRIIDSGRLFLGGVSFPVGKNAIKRGQIQYSKSYEGVLNDITFNFEPAQLNEYVTRLNVTQGYASLQPETSQPEVVNKKLNKRCAAKAQIGQVESAWKFGDSNNSYVSVDLKKRKIKQKYNMSFEFRTHYPDGLLIVLNGEMSIRKSKGQRPPKGKSNDLHFVVYLSNSSIKVTDTTSTNPASIEGFFHDGQWHKVIIRQSKKKIEIEVDTKKTVVFKSSLTKLRSAGFGNVYTFIKNIRRAQSVASFKGCIRKYQVNNEVHDLSGASVKSENVGICFSDVEAGSWFGGDAYAIYDSSFKVEINIEMTMQFRTTETSGLLISIIEPKGLTGLQLGLLNGNITMRVILANGVELNSNVDFGEAINYICDDHWHNVTATYATTGYISIVVDDKYRTSNKNLKTQGQLSPSQLGPGPLYIGGLPDDGGSQTSKRFIRDNFQGCIRNVVIANHIKDWVDMSSLHNVLINSCYLQHNSTP